MEQHPQKKDSTSLILMIAGGAVLALAVLALVTNLISTIKKNSVDSDAKTEYQQQAMIRVLQPIGKVAAIDKSLAPVERSGEQVYNLICGSCHANALLGSPKTNSAADWGARAGLGLDGLVTSAINGKGAMPARGGDPSITDEEIRSAILFMTRDTGINWDAAGEDSAMDSSATAAVAVEATPEQTEDAQLAADNTLGIQVYATNCFVCHDTGAVGSPKLADKAAWSERLAKGESALYDAAINGLNAMPSRGGNPSLTDEQITAAVNYMVSTVQ